MSDHEQTGPLWTEAVRAECARQSAERGEIPCWETLFFAQHESLDPCAECRNAALTAERDALAERVAALEAERDQLRNAMTQLFSVCDVSYRWIVPALCGPDVRDLDKAMEASTAALAVTKPAPGTERASASEADSEAAEHMHQDGTITLVNTRYGCHVDLCEGEPPDGCVVSDGDHDSCIYARLANGDPRPSPWSCSYWKPFNKK